MDEKTGSTARFAPQSYQQLQNLLRKDPDGYYEEFTAQLEHFSSLLGLVLSSPTVFDETMSGLLSFLSHTVGCYPQHVGPFLQSMIDALSSSGELSSSLRQNMIQALLLTQRKGPVSSVGTLVPRLRLLQFELLGIQDKDIRHQLRHHLLSDFKCSNINERKNISRLISESLQVPGTRAKTTLRFITELFRKNIWRENETIRLITQAALDIDTMQSTIALRFLVCPRDRENKEEEDEGEMEEEQVEQLDSSGSHDDSSGIFLLDDPYEFAKKLLDRGGSGGHAYEYRLLVFRVVSMVICIHEIHLPLFFSQMIRYLKPNQKDVTRILAYVSQAFFDIDEECFLLVTRTILKNFVAEYCRPEVITVGLNSLREIASRCPTAIEPSGLEIAISFCSYKNKGVVAAARSLLSLYRRVLPDYLPKKSRGKPHAKMRRDDAKEDFESVSGSEDEEEDGLDYAMRSRILTDAELGEVRRKRQEGVQEMFVSEDSLSKGIRQKMTAEERLESVHAGRREKSFVSKFVKRKRNGQVGLSNWDKRKTKSLSMTKHKRGGRLSRTKKCKVARKHGS